MKTRFLLLLAASLASCNPSTPPESPSTERLTVKSYGTLPDGREVKLFTLRNKNGMTARVTEYGAILAGLDVPDKDGTIKDVTHGYDDLAGWLTNTSYFGATVGRFGNRIANGKFNLDGTEYTLATNNDPGGIPCHLHGGIKGFDKVLWSGEAFENDEASGVTLTYVSPDGEEGYPGTLTVEVTYTLTDDNELVWKATATVEGKATPVNVVHHSYWNLSGDPTTSINDHLLTLHADQFLPTDAGLIPLGTLAPVAGTPFDFTKPTAIGERVEAEDENLKHGAGYDHCWVLRPIPDGQDLRHAATLKDPETGRTMAIHTDQPGIQFYGGNFLDGTVAGKSGVEYAHRTALCLESEGFPDAPNHENFPNAILRPGETYSHTMVHSFSW